MGFLFQLNCVFNLYEVRSYVYCLLFLENSGTFHICYLVVTFGKDQVCDFQKPTIFTELFFEGATIVNDEYYAHTKTEYYIVHVDIP